MQPLRKDTMNQFDDDRNLDARFLPQDPDDPDSLPCVDIGGVQVYTYFKHGELHINVHYDGLDIDAVTPTLLTLGDTRVYPTATTEHTPTALETIVKDFLHAQYRISRVIEETNDPSERMRLLGLAEARTTLRTMLDGTDAFLDPHETTEDTTTSHQLGRRFRRSWINAVRRYHPDIPNEAHLVPWDDMATWEQRCADTVAIRLAECISSAGKGARKLEPDEQSQLVTAIWNAHVHCFHPDPGPSYTTPWHELPVWRRNVNTDIFEDLTEAVAPNHKNEVAPE